MRESSTSSVIVRRSRDRDRRRDPPLVVDGFPTTVTVTTTMADHDHEDGHTTGVGDGGDHIRQRDRENDAR